MASIVARTLIIYILLTFSLKIMGKRQLGELDVSELVSTLLISEIAAIPIDNSDIPLFSAIIPILLIISLEILISSLKNKSENLKSAIEGKPSYIIYKGRLLQNALAENRISVNELLSELRGQGIGDIRDVEYAIIEQNGKLSVIKCDSSPLFHPLVIDGEIKKDTAERLGLDKEQLDSILSSEEVHAEDILLLNISDGGEIYIIKKDGSF